MTTLYSMTAELMQSLEGLYERAENGEIVTNEEFSEVLQLQQDTEQKLVNVAHVVKNLLSDSEQIDAEIKRLQSLKRTKDNRVNWLKGNMVYTMQVLGIEKVKDPVMPISLRSNPQFSVNVDSIDKLPDEYRVVKVEPNKKALLEAYRASNDFSIDGVTFTKGQFVKIG